MAQSMPSFLSHSTHEKNDSMKNTQKRTGTKVKKAGSLFSMSLVPSFWSVELKSYRMPILPIASP